MELVKKHIKKLKIRKNHLDWIAAVLSIPVLLTVMILNLNNLNSQKKNVDSPTPKPVEKVIVVPQDGDKSTPQPTNPSCKKDVGPIEITFPKEGEIVTENPVCINIKYSDSNYCSVVWSYRINDGPWSEYNSNSPCLYNLPQGDVKFELRIQSTASQDQEMLTRNFTYKSSLTPTSSITPTITP